MLRDALMLGLAPENFWRLGVREWRALAPRGGNALSRADFEGLSRAFPDQTR